MTEPNNYEVIPTADENTLRRRLPTWAWLLIALGVVLFAFAAGMAFATYAARMNGNTPPAAPLPAATPTVLVSAPISATVPATPNNTLASPTALPTLAGTATPTPTLPVACVGIVNEQLASLYAQSELGCPTDGGAVVWAAWESFERGAMLWRSDTDRAYAFFADGAWITIDERWDNKEIPSRGEPPPGLVAPIRGFGYAWAVRDELFQRLGWATTEEKGFCAFIQSFEGGFILQSDTVEFCREQLYNQARAPDWTPLRFVATYDGIWRSQ